MRRLKNLLAIPLTALFTIIGVSSVNAGQIIKYTQSLEVGNHYSGVVHRDKYQITVQGGDNLCKLAEELRVKWGECVTWKNLHDSNKKTIGDNPNLIKPGMVLEYTTSIGHIESI